MNKFSRHRDASPAAVQEMRSEMFERIQELLGYDSILPEATIRGLRRAAFSLYLDTQAPLELDTQTLHVLVHAG